MSNIPLTIVSCSRVSRGGGREGRSKGGRRRRRIFSGRKPGRFGSSSVYKGRIGARRRRSRCRGPCRGLLDIMMIKMIVLVHDHDDSLFLSSAQDVVVSQQLQLVFVIIVTNISSVLSSFLISTPVQIPPQQMSSPLTVFLLSFRHLSEASPVTKLMNSETHSCIVCLASFEILAFGGRICFMILPTLAMPVKTTPQSRRRHLASAAQPTPPSSEQTALQSPPSDPALYSRRDYYHPRRLPRGPEGRGERRRVWWSRAAEERERRRVKKLMIQNGFGIALWVKLSSQYLGLIHVSTC
ncbi:hypothetical protein ACLB2K_017459 [Fragaria x ananassa]